MKKAVFFTFAIFNMLVFTASLQSQNWDNQIRLLLLDAEFEEVLSVSDTIQVADTLMDKLYYYKAKAYQSLFQFDSALHYYNLASGLDGSNISYRIAVGQMLSKLGRGREAIEAYEKAGKFNSLEKNQLVELAGLYTLNNRQEESLEIYLELHKQDPENYWYLKQAGKAYQALGQTDSALVFFRTASAINPQDSYLNYQIANIYLKQKNLIDAIQYLEQGIEHDSNNLDLLKLRGYVLMHSNLYEEAIRDFERAGSMDSASLFIQKYLGMSYHENKNFERAREALLRAFQLDSMDAEIAYFLGSSSRWSGYEEEGVEFYLKSIELQQPVPDQIKNVFIQLAELYKVLHRFNEALSCYHQALEYDPADNTVYYKIAQMYDRNLNQKQTAIEYYEKYLQSGNTNQQLFDTSDGSSKALGPYVEQRIRELREDQFFEN